MWNKLLISTILLLLIATSASAFTKQDWIPRLVSNTQYCKDDCALTLTMCNPMPAARPADFTYEILDAKNAQLGSTSESIKWLNHTWTESTPIISTVTVNYTCAGTASYKNGVFTCSATTTNGTTTIFEREASSVLGKTAYWQEQQITGHTTRTLSELVGETGKLKNLKVTPKQGSMLPGACVDVAITGSLRSFNDAVDLIPSWGGYSFPEYAVWNSSLFNISATPNVTGVAVNNSEAILYLKISNCTDGTGYPIWNSSANNASCRYNLCKHEMGCAEDCSDIEIYDASTNQTLAWVAIPNATGVSYYINSTNDTLYWDAIRVLNFTMNGTNSTPIRASCNGTNTSSKNNDANPDLVTYAPFVVGLISNSQLIDWADGDVMTNVGAVYWQNASCNYGSFTNVDCYDFTDDYIHVSTDGSGLQIGTDVTVAIWTDWDDGGADEDDLYSNWQLSGIGLGLSIAVDASNVLYFQTWKAGGASEILKGGTMDSNVAFYVFTFNDALNNKSIYKNGILINSSTWASSISFHPVSCEVIGDLEYGATCASHYGAYNGRIMSVRVYNRSLSSAEVLGLYNEPKHKSNKAWTSQSTIMTDTTPPVINWVSPVIPDGSVVSGDYLSVYFTSSENGVCLLYFNTSALASNASVVALTNTTFNITMPADGFYVYYVACNDSFNNTGNSSNMTVIIDNTPPNLELLTPPNGSTVAYNVSTFTWLLSDALLDAYNFSCLMLVDDAIFYINLTDTAGMHVFMDDFSVGLHNWTVICTDFAGNTNNSDVWYFTILPCPLNASVLCNGCRYQTRNLTSISASCGGAMTNCSVRINDYLYESVSNCSSFNLTLEVGRNTINLTGTSAGGVVSAAYFVWAKSGSWTDMLPAILPGMAGIIALVTAFITGFVGFFVLAGFLFALLAYELVAFSMSAAVLCLLVAIGMLLGGLFR